MTEINGSVCYNRRVIRSKGVNALNRSLPPYEVRRRYDDQPICTDPTADPKENETDLSFFCEF